MRNIFAFAFAAAGLLLATAPHAHAFSQYTLYNFTGKADGGNPIGGVVQDAAGNYYGTTYQGGSYTCRNPPYNRQGCGTVYRLAPDGTFTVLASFTGANGAHGNSTPILIGNTLYGTTAQGGPANAGTVFSVHTDGTAYTLLHQFAGTDGSDPQTLVAGHNNVVYGITAVAAPAPAIVGAAPSSPTCHPPKLSPPFTHSRRRTPSATCPMSAVSALAPPFTARIRITSFL